MTKYYMFSQGEYSDYCVGGLYVTEEDVPYGEFDKMREEYKSKQKILVDQSYIAFGERTGKGHQQVTTSIGISIQPSSYEEYYKSLENEILDLWRKDNDPSEAFKAKYNLKQVAYEECWEY